MIRCSCTLTYSIIFRLLTGLHPEARHNGCAIAHAGPDSRHPESGAPQGM